MCTLEEKREICSKYIRNKYGEKYDFTPWWDKLQVFAYYKEITKGDNYATEICNFRQTDQEAAERIL